MSALSYLLKVLTSEQNKKKSTTSCGFLFGEATCIFLSAETSLPFYFLASKIAVEGLSLSFSGPIKLPDFISFLPFVIEKFPTLFISFSEMALEHTVQGGFKFLFLYLVHEKCAKWEWFLSFPWLDEASRFCFPKGSIVEMAIIPST